MGSIFYLIGKIDAYLYKAIRWGYNGNLKMLSELLHDADTKLFRSRGLCCIVPTVFASYSAIEVYANESPHFSLRFCCPLLPLNLYTNIHLCYDVFLTEHNIPCVVVSPPFIVILFCVFSKTPLRGKPATAYVPSA